MNRRKATPDSHPAVSGFRCPSCTNENVRLATVAEQFFYLRCDACAHIWSHPERRLMQRREYLADTPSPLKAELPKKADRRQA